VDFDPPQALVLTEVRTMSASPACHITGLSWEYAANYGDQPALDGTLALNGQLLTE